MKGIQRYNHATVLRNCVARNEMSVEVIKAIVYLFISILK